MKFNRLYILGVIVLACCACKQGAQFEGYHHLDNEEWCINDTAKFEVDIPAPGTYNISLCVRHTTDYEMANLWCFVHVQDTLHHLISDTVNIRIAQPDGRWIGTGGSVKNVEFPINKHDIKLEKGLHTVSLVQAMRTRCQKGLKDIGIKITKAGEHGEK